VRASAGPALASEGNEVARADLPHLAAEVVAVLLERQILELRQRSSLARGSRARWRRRSRTSWDCIVCIDTRLSSSLRVPGNVPPLVRASRQASLPYFCTPAPAAYWCVAQHLLQSTSALA
jgi:hypothetical protein